MKMNIAALFLITLVSFACSSDNDVVSPEINELQNKIIGTWTDSLNFIYTITYLSDGTFIDSSKGAWVRSGNYTITNSTLSKSNFRFLNKPHSAFHGTTLISTLEEISINNSVLSQKPFMQFSNSNSSQNILWGNWETTGWFCQFSNSESGSNRFGTYKEQFSFVKDSLDCDVIRTRYYSEIDSVYQNNYKMGFTYTPPMLNLNSSIGDISVDFRDSKMYWYLIQSETELKKLN